MAQSDVLYSTRVQKERFADLEQYERLKNSFIIDNALLKHAKSHMVVMHPLPRNAEIAEEVDFDQRAAYFRQVSLDLSIRPTDECMLTFFFFFPLQMRYGLYCRMALLALIMAP